MPKIFRAMLRDGNKPAVGSSARKLGVRVPPNPKPDLEINVDGTVQPGGGGMSVAPNWRLLPSHRVPMRLRHTVPKAAGSNDLACWSMGEGNFEPSIVSDELALQVDTPKHGVLEPANRMSLAEYIAAIVATRDLWVIDES